MDMHATDDTKEQGYQLHKRLIAGEITAPAEVAEFLLPIVTNRLSRVFPYLDDAHLVDTAVEDAILNYIEKPNKYQPERLSLESYMVMSAKRDLLNLLSQKKSDIQVSLAEIVELGGTETEQGVELSNSQDVEEIILNRLSPTWKNLCALLPNPVDQQLLLMMMGGVRDTNVYGEILSIADLTIEEQEKIVKRHKDRIKKKILRHINPVELKK
jgi:RNA polymerase sigma-70 factor (ECF subfamily)